MPIIEPSESYLPDNFIGMPCYLYKTMCAKPFCKLSLCHTHNNDKENNFKGNEYYYLDRQ